MAEREILAAIAGAAQSSAFNIVKAATITSTELGAGETINIQITHDGTTWQDLFRSGVQQQLLPDNNAVTVEGPGKFRADKSVTVAATSIKIWT